MAIKVDIEKSDVYKTMPGIKSTDADWIKWSDRVMNRYGSSLGKQVFLAAWNKRGGQAANTYEFRKHIRDAYGLEINESAWNKITDFGGGVAESVGKVLKVGKYVLIGGAILAGIVIITMGITVAKNPSALLKR